MRIKWGNLLLFFLILLLIIGFWGLIVHLHIWKATIVPSPIATLNALAEYRTQFLGDFLYTLGLICEGFLFTILAALGISVGLHLLPKISKAIYSLAVILQSVPLFAVAPIIFYFVGRDNMRLGQLITIFLTSFFPVFVNTTEGLQRTDRDLKDVFISMNANKWQRLTRLELPTALHMILAGMKVTLTMCVIGAVIAEMMIGDLKGLGFRIKDANAHMNMPEVFAGLFLLACLTMLLFIILGTIAGILQPWDSQRGQNEN